MSRLSWPTSIIACIVGVLTLIAPAAAAAESQIHPGMVEIPMTITGFDPGVAAANGYPTTRPADHVAGNCGTSYLFMDPGVQRMTIRTGFTIVPAKPPATYVSWRVNIRKDTGGGFMMPWSESVKSGGVVGPSYFWHGQKVKTNLAPGLYEGLVTVAAAQLSNGEICTSGHPTASARVVNP